MTSPSAIVATLLFLLSAPVPGPTDDEPHAARMDAVARREVIRLQAHFDSVLSELHAHSTIALNASQRVNRQILILWLKDYRDSGLFPRNDQVPERPTPFFRDSRGVLCAMAYLVQRSGRSDLVDRIARTANNATIAELSGDEGLRTWFDSVGFTAAEAGRVQPGYNFPNPITETDVAVERRSLPPAASMALNMASLATAAVNIKSPSPTSALLGVAAGLVGFVAGAQQVHESRDGRAYAISNMVTGAAAVTLAAMRLIRPAKPNHLKVESGSAAPSRLHGAPTLTLINAHPQFGVMLQPRFR
jgi:hypothetical protein